MSHYRYFSVWIVLLAAVLLSTPTASAQLSTSAQLLWEENLDTEEQDSLLWPVAVACRDPKEIAVLDAYDPRFLIYTRTGDLDPWKISQSQPLPAAPADIVFDGERYLVALRGLGELLVFADPDGQPENLALPPGVIPSQLAANRDGTLAIVDAAGERILRLDRSGAVRSEIANVKLASGLAIEARGSVLVALSYPPVIQRYGANNEMVSEWQVPGVNPSPAWPASLAAGTDGSIVISDRSGGRLYVLDRYGSPVGAASRKGWKPGRLLRPVDVSPCPEQRFVVADRGTGRVSIFRQVEID